MTPAARIAAAAQVLDDVLGGMPAERELLRWSRNARYAGSKDRAAVRDLVFDALRRRRSLAWVGGSETGRGLMLGALRLANADPAALMTGQGHALAPPAEAEVQKDLRDAPESIRLDVPDWLLAMLRTSLGGSLEAFCEASRARGPVHLRVNLARASPEQATMALAAEGIKTEPLAGISTALAVTEGAALVARSSSYANGLVEFQDGSSQAAVQSLPLNNGDRVLDLCAGGGGKTLAMGARAQLTLHAHDVEARRMADLPTRATRAGVQVEIIMDSVAAAPYDLVFVDAPCSGSGTWRRTPDARWRLSPDGLAQLVALQARLIREAAPLVAPGGSLAFATCSVLDCEGSTQVAAFLQTHHEWVEEGRFIARPGPAGDGFFQAVLRRT